MSDFIPAKEEPTEPRTDPDRSTDLEYCGVTNWTIVHELIRACVLNSKDPSRAIAKTQTELALKLVDEAHADAIKYAKHAPFLGFIDDRQDDGDVPLISESEDADGITTGIWVSESHWYEIESDEDDADTEEGNEEEGAEA